MTTVHAEWVDIPCISAGSTNRGPHRFAMDANGTLTPNAEDSELVAEVLSGDAECLLRAQRGLDAIHYRNAVIQRRIRPTVHLHTWSSPVETRRFRWYTDGQAECCTKGQYWSFVPAINHLLCIEHLAARFGSTAEMVAAANRAFGSPHEWAEQPVPGSPPSLTCSRNLAEALWNCGIDAAEITPGPWTTRGFPEHLQLACELARAYAMPGFQKASVERKEAAQQSPFDPEEWTSLMVGWQRGDWVGFKFGFKYEFGITHLQGDQFDVRLP